MFLGKTVVHGIYALCYLSRMRPDEVASSVVVGNAVDIPYEQSRKILSALAIAELVTSIRGRSGGYILAKNIQEISILSVVDALHPTAGLSALEARACPVTSRETCCVQPGLAELHDNVRALFADRTLASVIGEECRRKSRRAEAMAAFSPESDPRYRVETSGTMPRASPHPQLGGASSEASRQ